MFYYIFMLYLYDKARFFLQNLPAKMTINGNKWSQNGFSGFLEKSVHWFCLEIV